MISFSQLSLMLVTVGAVALVVIGSTDAPAPPPLAPAASRLPMGGLVLTSTSIEMPVETVTFPDLASGPSADAANANCTACHSASMATNQPALTPAQWTETVTKMREVYKAPIAPADTQAIVAYLAAMQSQSPPASG